MTAVDTVAGIVLAGGRSSRMGGGNKCLQPLSGRPLLAHVLARLTPQVSRIVVNANGDLSRFADFGLPAVSDRIEGFHGPLAGVEAGLSWVRENAPETSWAVTVPGDTPFIPKDLVARLAAAARAGATMAVAASEKGLHPVVGLWPVTMAQALATALREGERKAGRWVRLQGAAEVFFEPVEIGGMSIDPFFNINTPDDLDRAQEYFASSSGSL